MFLLVSGTVAEILTQGSEVGNHPGFEKPYPAKEEFVTKTRMEFSFERERLLVLSRREVSVAAWCGKCQTRVQMVLPDEAGRLVGSTARQIYQLVEAGRLHFLEGSEVGLLVCVESLNKLLEPPAGLLSEAERKEEEK